MVDEPEDDPSMYGGDNTVEAAVKARDVGADIASCSVPHSVGASPAATRGCEGRRFASSEPSGETTEFPHSVGASPAATRGCEGRCSASSEPSAAGSATTDPETATRRGDVDAMRVKYPSYPWDDVAREDAIADGNQTIDMQMYDDPRTMGVVGPCTRCRYPQRGK